MVPGIRLPQGHPRHLHASAQPALALFGKFKFKHSRTRDVSGKSLLYFYLDLYSGDRPVQKKE